MPARPIARAMTVAALLALPAGLGPAGPAKAETIVAETAVAGTVRADDPDSVLAALRSAGFGAELRRTNRGDPLISAATPDGLPFHARFFGCRNGAGCTSLQLLAGFAARRVPAETVNDWNAALRFGRVHVTEGGQPLLAFDLLLEPGGLTAAQFTARLELWERLMDETLARLEP